MEAAPRLPMISFDLKASPEPANFGPVLKQYIASFYHEDPESYSTEIHTLESLRAAAVRPSSDVAGCQTLKRYYSQLSFLKSRFPMGKGQAAAVAFAWKDAYTGGVCTSADIDFEMGSLLYNIGALHSQLGAADSRSTPDGMKMACTHFQCAAWAFQQIREQCGGVGACSTDLLHFMAQLCLAQAQECILEKSMMDGRKASIIARVAAQLVDYYGQALSALAAGDESPVAEAAGARAARDWARHLAFKAQYHGCVALLYQGQQSEEQQKMGERVAYYQAASEALERARRAANDMGSARRHDVDEALAFTQDVVEGKRKAARNENEFIYHERVPEREALARVQGASLVKGIAFSVADPDVAGLDIFKRLVPMEAHEASSVYSEQKAEMLRQVVALVETKDAELAEFVSSLRLDVIARWRQASAVPTEVVDRAAALCARPHAVQTLVDAMARLGTACRDVDSLLADIRALVAHDEQSERNFQNALGAGRPPGLVATELAREAAKYSEAHTKAADSNDALHRAMTVHVANLRALQRPLAELRSSVPCTSVSDPNIDEAAVAEVEALAAKVDEMRAQRTALVAGLREAVRADDITALLVTRPTDVNVEQLFQQQLAKHGRQAALIEQNLAAQQNILAAMTEAYARFGPSRRHMAELLRKRDSTAAALVASYDAYDDLLAKVNKGIEFYQKLESNVSKLLQRVRSACRVNDEERDQVLANTTASISSTINTTTITTTTTTISASNVAAAMLTSVTSGASATPKLKDYLASMKQAEAGATAWHVPAVRPAPLGSETTGDTVHDAAASVSVAPDYYGAYAPAALHAYYASSPATAGPTSYAYPYQQPGYAPPDGYAAYSTPYTTTSMTTATATYSDTSYGTYQAFVAPASDYRVSGAVYAPPTTMYMSPGAEYHMPSTSNYLPTDTGYAPLTKSYATPAPGYVAPTANAGYMPPTAYVAPRTTNPEYVSPIITNVEYVPPTSHYATASSAYVEPNTTITTTTTTATTTTSTTTSTCSNYATISSEYVPGATNAPTANSGYIGVNSTLNAGYVVPPTNSTDASGRYAVPTATPAGVYGGPVASDPTYAATGGGYSTPGGYSEQYYPAGYQQQAQQVYGSQAQYTNAGAYPTSQTDSQQGGAGQAAGLTGDSAQYYMAPYGYQTPGTTPLTMVHANNNKAGAMTSSQTNGAATTTTPKESTSNVDLLAGLDMSVTQAPLVPQVSVPPTAMAPVHDSDIDNNRTTTTTDIPTNSVAENQKEHQGGTTTQQQQQQHKEEIDEEQQVNENQDPLEEAGALESFAQEVERLQKLVAGLTTRSLNGPTLLDAKWKEVQMGQERAAAGRSISVARCYPMKNRCADILPYDQTRVELPSTKDDYINASHVRVARCPPLIVTQAPLPATLPDFWAMVCEQQVEVCVCLLGDTEPYYWPATRGAALCVGTRYQVTLRGLNESPHWTERVLAIADSERPGTPPHVLVHLQFTAWPGGGLTPAEPGPIVALARATLACHREQRARARPVLVHCLAGVGPSGVFCVLLAATADPSRALDVARLAALVGAQRKNALRDREHLRFAYGAVLHLAQEVLSARRGTDVPGRLRALSLEAATAPALSTPNNAPAAIDPCDPLSTLDPLWTLKK